ncbi:hypothetical protein [Prosthecobacter sp.]|uniref:hypothetical protein n=1 Tax=Prosthecobacter sp. TaxID=1965333 RepID=UPI0037830E66
MSAPQACAFSFPRPLRLLHRFVFWTVVVWFFFLTIRSTPAGSPFSESEPLITLPGFLLLAGLFVPGWTYRIASVVIIIFCILNVIYGRRNDAEYQPLFKQYAPPQHINETK